MNPEEENISVVYAFEWSEWDEHYNVAFFDNVAAAIEFGVHNMLVNRYRTQKQHYDLKIYPNHKTFASHQRFDHEGFKEFIAKREDDVDRAILKQYICEIKELKNGN